MSDKPLFRVIDTQTGQEPDIKEIALNEPWAKGLIYCDMEGWLIGNDGSLVLVDECGSFAFPPRGRYRVEWQTPAKTHYDVRTDKFASRGMEYDDAKALYDSRPGPIRLIRVDTYRVETEVEAKP